MKHAHASVVLGIIGVGTVGKALWEAFSPCYRVMLHDPALEGSVPLEQVLAGCQVVFIAVPTPMGPEGNADTAIFREVAEAAGQWAAKAGRSPVLCVKSAVPPDGIREVVQRWPLLRWVVSPEFLRESSAVEDMLNTRSLVLGGAPDDCEAVAEVYRNAPSLRKELRITLLRDAVGAAFLKYQENCFLAMKVSFMNECYEVFTRMGSMASWEELQQAFHQDHERMGSTHWQVPGPDGLRGWGGKCFPKDVAAFRAFAGALGVETPLMQAVWERNQTDRTKPA